MSTYEALRFFGLDYYATSIDIKAAYRRLANCLHPNPAVDDLETVRVAEERLRMLNRAYEVLQDRVGHTSPDIDPLLGTEVGGAKPRIRTTGVQMMTSGLGVAGSCLRWSLKRGGEWWTRIRIFQGKLPRLGFPLMGRMAGIFVVMASAAGYGIVRGVSAKHFAPTVVAAKTVPAAQVEPMLPVAADRVTAAGKASSAHEKKSLVSTGSPRSFRAPALPSLDPVEAKAIGSACQAQTGANGFEACVLRTARETPHPIHLE